MQHRVKRSGAQLVAVTAQLLHDPEAEDRLLARVIEDMQTDQACVKLGISPIPPVRSCRLKMRFFPDPIRIRRSATRPARAGASRIPAAQRPPDRARSRPVP